jgi:uncharacterized delta-60 repeat protein
MLPRNRLTRALAHAAVAVTLSISAAWTALPVLAAPSVLPATRSGALDPTFGEGSGAVVHSYGTNYDYAVMTLVQPDGKYIVVGYGYMGVEYAVGFVARHLPDGSYDPSFNGTGRRGFGDTDYGVSIVHAALQPDGKIVVVGDDYREAIEHGRGWMARVNADGSVDRAFGDNGIVRFEPLEFPYRYLNAVSVRADGSLLVAGYEQAMNNATWRAFTARLSPDGRPDLSYGPAGVVWLDAAVPNFRPRQLVVNAAGKLFITGTTRIAAAPVRYEATLVRLHGDGTLDTGYATLGKATYAPPQVQQSEFYDQLHDAAGNLTTVGSVTVAGVLSSFLFRLDANGQPVAAFGQQGIRALPGAMSGASGLARMADGRIVVSGANYTTDDDAMIARVFDDGQLDPSFGVGGLAHISVGYTSAGNAGPSVDADGKIVVAGRSVAKSGDKPNAMLFRVIGTEITTPVIEFYNGTLDHYFITADPNEATAIDNGAAGPGWARTGQTFKSGGPNRVCRFYGSPEIDPATQKRRGPNSHFYTIETGECTAVKTDAGWKFESYDFNGWPIAQGACPQGTQAIKRVYNKRFAQNDSNHRYVTTDALYQQMVALGWAGEGIVFCAAQ